MIRVCNWLLTLNFGVARLKGAGVETEVHWKIKEHYEFMNQCVDASTHDRDVLFHCFSLI